MTIYYLRPDSDNGYSNPAPSNGPPYYNKVNDQNTGSGYGYNGTGQVNYNANHTLSDIDSNVVIEKIRCAFYILHASQNPLWSFGGANFYFNDTALYSGWTQYSTGWYYSDYYTTNPVTGLAWTTSDLNGGTTYGWVWTSNTLDAKEAWTSICEIYVEVTGTLAPPQSGAALLI